MRAENLNHVPVKHVGLVNFVRVRVGIPSKKEAEQAARALAPLQRRVGVSLNEVVNAQCPSFVTRIRRSFTR